MKIWMKFVEESYWKRKEKIVALTDDRKIKDETDGIIIFKKERKKEMF